MVHSHVGFGRCCLDGCRLAIGLKKKSVSAEIEVLTH
jgi:hypothetical protein